MTNKTVSRWETGTYLPPADILLAMSGFFGVSINELLSGRRLADDEYRQVAEENLQQVVAECSAQAGASFTLKDRVEFFRGKWLRGHVAVMVAMVVCIAGILAAGIALGKPLVVSAAVVLLIPAHAWCNNAMAAYVEKNTFDGSGS